ncbi:MAG: hypothetical protein EOP04_21595 [Proteobacteria bacterium]|nr:MAG: hypothetical protein EOP04_21595 [Pseudomonadota bacterium]
MNRKLGTEISTMIFVLAVTFISIALSTIAYAIPGDSICDKDIVRLCPGVQPGDGRIGKDDGRGAIVPRQAIACLGGSAQ